MVTFSTDIYTVEKKAAITSAFIVLALTSILPFLFFWGWYISFTNTILLGLFSICFLI